MVKKYLDIYLDMSWQRRDKIRFYFSSVVAIVCLLYSVFHFVLRLFPFFGLSFSVDFDFVLILVLCYYFLCLPGNCIFKKESGGKEWLVLSILINIFVCLMRLDFFAIVFMNIDKWRNFIESYKIERFKWLWKSFFVF